MAGRNGNGRSGGTAQKEKGSPPCYTRKYWTGSGVIELAIFPNEDGTSCTIKKSYKSGEEYKESKSFFQQDVAILAAGLVDIFNEMQRIKEDSQ